MNLIYILICCSCFLSCFALLVGYIIFFKKSDDVSHQTTPAPTPYVCLLWNCEKEDPNCKGEKCYCKDNKCTQLDKNRDECRVDKQCDPPNKCKYHSDETNVGRCI